MSDDWSYAHDLVNVYLGIARLADNELDPREKETLSQKFTEWMPHLKAGQFHDVWADVESLYDSLGSNDNRYSLFLQSTLNIARLMDDDRAQLEYIIRDLADIAAADGMLRDSEVTMIKAAAYAYGLNVDVGVDEATGRAKVSFGRPG